jgi:hypothetical protein
MKLLDEFREPEVITKAAEEIRRRADPIRHYRIMEYAVDTRTRFAASV